MSHFIYCPRSGDRVFIQSASYRQPRLLNGGGPIWVGYDNGCRHVLGGVVLSFDARQPGNWFRDQAKAVAAAIVVGCGGLGWDEQGDISIAVPAYAAFQSWMLMSELSKRSRWEDHRNISRMLASRCIAIAESDPGTEGIRYRRESCADYQRDCTIAVDGPISGEDLEASVSFAVSLVDTSCETPMVLGRCSAPWEPELWS